MKIIKIYGDNCSGCKIMQPIREEAKKKHPDIEFQELKIEDNQEVVTLLKIRSVPTFIIEWEEELSRKSGVMMPNEFEERFTSFKN